MNTPVPTVAPALIKFHISIRHPSGASREYEDLFPCSVDAVIDAIDRADGGEGLARIVVKAIQ